MTGSGLAGAGSHWENVVITRCCPAEIVLGEPPPSHPLRRETAMRRFVAPLTGAWLALAALLGPVAAQIPGCPTVGSNCVTIQGFQPLTKTTLAVSSTSSNVALPTFGASYNVLITNAGSTDAYLLLGTTSGVVATTSNPILAAGQSVWLPQGTNAYVAAITASSTTNLTIQSGAGTPTIVTAQGTFSLAPGTSVSISGTVTTTPAATTPRAYTSLPSATVTTSSAPLYTYGTPASVLNLSNSGTTIVWINTVGTAGGACNAAVAGTGIPLYPGAGYLFGPSVPLPTCAITGISASATDNVGLAGY